MTVDREKMKQLAFLEKVFAHIEEMPYTGVSDVEVSGNIVNATLYNIEHQSETGEADFALFITIRLD